MSEPVVLEQLRPLLVPVENLTHLEGNPRRGNVERVAASLLEFGQHKPLVARRLGSDDAGLGIGVVLAGNHTLDGAVALGWDQVAVVFTDDDELVAKARSLADNHSDDDSFYDEADLAAMLAEVAADPQLLAATSWSTEDLAQLLGDDAGAPVRPGEAHNRLRVQFVAPPFSVLDARQGYWQERKKLWLALGIRSELGRGQLLAFESAQRGDFVSAEIGRRGGRAVGPVPGGGAAPGASSVWLRKDRAGGLVPGTAAVNSRRAADQRSNLTGAPPLPAWARNGVENMASGTSIFDPVLCEIVYSWFSREGDAVLDPFAGGSVRGVVASLLGRRYHGVDLSAAQLAANREQAEAICAHGTLAAGPAHAPAWHHGDARQLAATWPQGPARFDLVFTCPPYFDLEVYSDDPADLSQCPSLESFEAALGQVLAAAAGRLRNDRFAVVVMGEARAAGDTGQLYGLVPATVRAAAQAGLAYYNEAILVTMVGSLALRVEAPFQQSRKLGRTHQTVLVFVKGSPRKAAAHAGQVRVAEFTPEAPEGL